MIEKIKRQVRDGEISVTAAVCKLTMSGIKVDAALRSELAAIELKALVTA